MEVNAYIQRFLKGMFKLPLQLQKFYSKKSDIHVFIKCYLILLTVQSSSSITHLVITKIPIQHGLCFYNRF